jgi:hypothetical protein
VLSDYDFVGRVMLTDWSETKLWHLLESRGAEDTRHYLKLWLDEVQSLLAKGGTAPLDFTLHDDDHSYRVAQRMLELIPPDTLQSLSDYEVSLLLLSSYLHDIGMNPRRSIVRQVRDYLLSGDVTSIDEFEAAELRKWLDSEHPGVQPPINQDLQVVDRVSLAEFLTAYFCRHRHNDWSEKYILEKAKDFKQHPYAAWIQDLVRLCKSHHYGFSALMTSAFDLRMVGPVGKIVNLRYLASVLRVADVLEFDPERTPAVIFGHRSPNFKSTIYWHKDHEISLSVEQGSWDIFFNARTDNAWTHKAILDTADAVDTELEVCAVIERQNGFLRGRRIGEGTHYRWPWSSRLSRIVEPLPDTFVYIDGSFRPDSQRVLSLLAGTQLYGTRFAAIRELLQNAFDAVREQIAVELLQDVSSSSSAVQLARAQLHWVTLVVEARGTEQWIVCSDTGSGMTRRIIEKYLLVSGSKPRPELLELQRDCLSKGVHLEKSGEFGIGVLSYFMIADKMVVETKSSGDFGFDVETHGWRFEIDGLDTVGELRPLNKLHRGTTISLCIKSDFKETLVSKEFELFLAGVIAKCPCNFEIKLPGFARTVGPGWMAQPDDWIEHILKVQFAGAKESHFRSSEEVQMEAEKRWLSIRDVARTRVRFLSSGECRLPSGAGNFRICIPYFQLEKGISLGFVHEHSNGLLALPIGDYCILATGRVSFSWRGFNVEDSNKFGRGEVLRSLPAIVEVDFIDEAKISVDREHLIISERKALTDFLSSEVVLLFDKFLKLQAHSQYAAIALSVRQESRIKDAVSEELSQALHWWAFPTDEGVSDERRLVWRQIRFPAIQREDVDLDRLPEATLKRNNIAEEVILLSTNDDDLSPLPGVRPSRLMLLDRPTPEFAAIYLADNIKQQVTFLPSRLSPISFPPDWSAVAVIETPGRIWVNVSHPTFGVGREAWTEMANASQAGRSEAILSSVSSSKEMAAAWFLYNCDEDVEFWRALKNEKNELVIALLDSLEITSWSKWSTDPFEAGLTVIDRSGFEHIAGIVRPGTHRTIPLPADDKWILQEKKRKKNR